MTFTRARRALPVALALALFLAGLGTALAHVHPTEPTCQVCKLVHHTPADLVRRTSSPEPLRATERLAPCSADAPHHADLAVPQGRAPPSA